MKEYFHVDVNPDKLTNKRYIDMTLTTTGDIWIFYSIQKRMFKIHNYSVTLSCSHFSETICGTYKSDTMICYRIGRIFFQLHFC